MDFFEKVYIVARCCPDSNKNLSNARLVEGNGVSVIPLTDYQGPLQYLNKSRKIFKQIKDIDVKNKTIILRAPGQLSNIFYNKIKNSNTSYSVELVGDPYDVFATKYNIIKLFFRYNFYLKTKEMTKNATAVSYVTERALQKRYSTNGYSINISSVNLPREFIAQNPKTFSNHELKNNINIISIGGMDQMYKGFDILLNAFNLLIKKVPHATLTIIGDGIHKSKLEDLANYLGLGNNVLFTGQVQSGEGIRSYLNKSDLFVLASRTEGLPRVIIEAMAVGLPCIGTRVGGIPELLDEDCLVEPDNIQDLYLKIVKMVSDISIMNQLSKHNIKQALKYEDSVLKEKRIQFFKEALGNERKM